MSRIQFRQDTATNLATVNPILRRGEPAVEVDTLMVKVGDGVTTWSNLPYVNGAVGDIKMIAHNSIEQGWLLCNGAAVGRTAYPRLFARIGTTYGAGDGSTTFNLPNFTNRFPRGNSPGVGGGADTHTHPLSDNGSAALGWTAASGPAQMRRASLPSWTANSVTTSALSALGASSTASNGGLALAGNTDGASNVPAYTGINFIIKY